MAAVRREMAPSGARVLALNLAAEASFWSAMPTLSRLAAASAIASMLVGCSGSPPPVESTHEADTTSGAAAPEREALLAAHRAELDARRDAVQAKLSGGITSANWATVATHDSWGPRATTYAPIAPPPGVTDVAAWRRELLLATVNYWVEQDLNYCHHHIPGWTPPNEPKYRNSSGGSTSGGAPSPMTCTANRFADGHQRVTKGKAHVCSATKAHYCDSPGEIDSPEPAQQVRWQGVDCSDFTSWVYNFAGFLGAALPTAITKQACTTDAGLGKLLAVDASNVATYEDQLRPGDLLYIRGLEDPSKITHVVIWSGMRWKDLRAGAAGAAYDPAAVGTPGSRLGGDFTTYSLTAAELETRNPYMIVDSHYAGPAYRPFAGWYAQSVAHVRRILDADSGSIPEVTKPAACE